MRRAPLFTLSFVTLALLLPGHAASENPSWKPRRSHVTVQSYRDDATTTVFRSYIIESIEISWAPDDVEIREIRDYVRTALSARGMYEAPMSEHADLRIRVTASRVRRSKPRLKRFIAFRPITERQVTGIRTEVDEAGNVRQIRETLTIPMPDHVGPSTRPLKMKQWFEKRLSLSARLNVLDGTPDRTDREVWRVEATTRETFEAMRPTVPVLVSAVLDRIGTNTAGREEITLTPSDNRVTFVTSNW